MQIYLGSLTREQRLAVLKEVGWAGDVVTKVFTNDEVAQALKQNTSLKSLVLATCFSGKLGLTILRHHPTLERVICLNEALPISAATAFTPALTLGSELMSRSSDHNRNAELFSLIMQAATQALSHHIRSSCYSNKPGMNAEPIRSLFDGIEDLQTTMKFLANNFILLQAQQSPSRR